VTVAKHEFGHAAFGLGEEYTEPQSTRNVLPPPATLSDTSCCCQLDATGTTGSDTGSGGVVTIGNGTKRCIVAGGGQRDGPIGTLDTGLQSCSGFTFPPQCGASADSGCPSLAGNCVLLQAWLGQQVTGASTARPNIFTSQQECQDSKQKATDHPAVEDPAKSLGTCRQICGMSGGLAPCPCGGNEFWIVDNDPGNAAATADTMGVVAAASSLQGGTCQWCVETSLCVRWHRARGDDPAKAWGACEAPSKQAVALEQFQRAMIAWINSIIALFHGLF
jgi:hypothetical protein